MRARSWEVEWRCFHFEACSACDKYFRPLSGGDCPDWHTVTADERQALDTEIARRVEARRLRQGNRPPVDGPQGYRRRR